MGASRWSTVVDFLLPTGCVVCRSWIPRPAGPVRPKAGSLRSTTGPGRTPAPIVCERCRSRLAAAGWPRCPRCHAPRGTGRAPAPDCLDCRSWPDELKGARSAYLLEPPATDLVHALKYEGWRELAHPMGSAIAEAARELLEDGRAGGGWLVVPVPTTPRRIRSRGYNQAGLLAEVVSDRTASALVDALERRSTPRSQTTLSPSERRENVRGAFVPSPSADRVRGRDVLLVDDVLTTGATAGEAARTLVAAGASGVHVATFGRALAGRAAPGRRTA